jgi:hypothetical protein
MSKMTADQIGHAAEVIVALQLSRLVGAPFRRMLFRGVHLGEKYPTADYLVDVLGADDSQIGHFFLQVKGTAGASRTSPRLAVDASVDGFNRLVRLPAPAYLVAVDVIAERAYLVAACRKRKTAVASVTKAFPLSDDAVKMELYREVLAFWAPHRATRRTSRFTDV